MKSSGRSSPAMVVETIAPLDVGKLEFTHRHPLLQYCS